MTDLTNNHNAKLNELVCETITTRHLKSNQATVGSLQVRNGAVAGYTLVASNTSGDLVYAPGGGGGVPEVWSYVPAAAVPGANNGLQNAALDIAAPSAGPANLVFPLPFTSIDDMATVGALMYFDGVNGSFRAGAVSGAQWKFPLRGAQSAAFGSDTIAAAARSFCTGQNNEILAGSDRSFVAGGNDNSIQAGGFDCFLSGITNTISGASEASAMAGSTSGIIASSNNAACVGGDDNTIASSSRSTITGGRINTISDTTNASILGGFNNQITLASTESSILGGTDNVITAGAERSTILGGQLNAITGSASDHFILGSQQSTVQAGNRCLVSTSQGVSVTSSGECAIISGSLSSILSSTRSLIVAAQFADIVSSNLCFAAGGGFIDTGVRCLSLGHHQLGLTRGIISCTTSSILSSFDCAMNGSTRAVIAASTGAEVDGCTQTAVMACTSDNPITNSPGIIVRTANATFVCSSTSEAQEPSPFGITGGVRQMIAACTEPIIESCDMVSMVATNTSQVVQGTRCAMTCGENSSIQSCTGVFMVGKNVFSDSTEENFIASDSPVNVLIRGSNCASFVYSNGLRISSDPAQIDSVSPDDDTILDLGYSIVKPMRLPQLGGGIPGPPYAAPALLSFSGGRLLFDVNVRNIAYTDNAQVLYGMVPLTAGEVGGKVDGYDNEAPPGLNQLLFGTPMQIVREHGPIDFNQPYDTGLRYACSGVFEFQNPVSLPAIAIGDFFGFNIDFPGIGGQYGANSPYSLEPNVTFGGHTYGTFTAYQIDYKSVCTGVIYAVFSGSWKLVFRTNVNGAFGFDSGKQITIFYQFKYVGSV